MPDTWEREWPFFEKAFVNVGTMTCNSSISATFSVSSEMNNIYKELAMNRVLEPFSPKGFFVD